jgi:L-fucose isomerase
MTATQTDATAALPRVALLTFSEGREDFYELRKGLVAQERDLLLRTCEGALDVTTSEPIRRKSELKAALAQLGAVDAVLVDIPIFVEPALVAAVAVLTQGTVPLVLLGNRRPDTSSLVGILGAGGVLDQIGIPHLRVWEDLEVTGLPSSLLAYVRAGRARRLLRGQTFGCFGGYSLGIQTAAADPVQWQSLFGVEVKHIDQYMIVVEAERLPQELVEQHCRWYSERVGGVYAEEATATAWLDRQMRSYLATRKLVRDLDLDFISVKCQSELSDHYALQCVSHSLLNDPWDADGRKEPLASSCEGDMDQALTMQLLKLLSSGKPTAALDVRLFEEDRGRFRLANCGSSPSAFATGADDPEEALAEVHLRPHVFGRAGGFATQFVFAPGEVTLARLARRAGRYWLAILRGRTVAEPRERLKETTWPWPHAFVEAAIDFPAFLAEFASNHICAVRGDVVEELEQWAAQTGIETRNFTP